MPCVMSIGVFCAIYMCMFIEFWIIIISYMRIISFLRKFKVIVYFCCSFIILGLVVCRRLSVHDVTIHVLVLCRCEFFYR